MDIITSNLVRKIKTSPTLAIADKAQDMKARGLDVISLSTGEPDFDTPSNVKSAAIQAINNGMTKYTAVDGMPSLKKAIQQKFQKDNGIEYATNQISVGSGAKHVIFNAILASLNPGQEVIIPAPYWVSYPEMVTFAGGIPVIVDCMSTGFKLTAENLERCITSKTKWLILNSPSNPTGVVYSAEELKSLSDILLKYPHVYILCDDIYEHIIFDDMKFSTLAAVEPRLYNRVLTVNGMSKGYAMTGWRLGYAGGPAELIKAMAVVQSQSTSNPCSISQAAGIEALLGKQDFVHHNAGVFERRRNLVLRAISDIDGLSCTKPQGAFYLFPDCSKFFGKTAPSGVVIISSIHFSSYLLEEERVAVVPGSAFGADNFFRISYAVSEDILSAAMKRIKNACEKLR